MRAVKKTSILFSALQAAGAARVAPGNRCKPHEKQEKCVFMAKKAAKKPTVGFLLFRFCGRIVPAMKQADISVAGGARSSRSPPLPFPPGQDVFGETPKTATETVALPKSNCCNDHPQQTTSTQ
jgi:hypothetical protein